MKIRLLRQGDIPQASAIVGLNYSRKYQKMSALELNGMFSNAPFKPRYFVAEDKGKIVGFIGTTISWMDYNVYQIFWVNVIPHRQGEGIGTELVVRAIAEIRKNKKAELIQLTANPRNSIYYKRFGFKVLERFCKPPYFLMSLKVR